MIRAEAGAAALQTAVPASSPIQRLRYDMQLAAVEFSLRDAVRNEQDAMYLLAGDAGLQSAVLTRLPPAAAAGFQDASEALRSLWRLAGITDFSLVRVHRTKAFRVSEPIASLRGYYGAAAQRYGIDWTYLAAINYVESDFGRVNGPSSAGALGPMQFLPSTWDAYGTGDIMSSHDSILAAAHYLVRLGAPASYDRALLGYNHDSDYVAAIQHFAAALRQDDRWLTRLYYWSTYG
jgi:membrane-bound lytic murein transglycosylase B